LSQGYPKLEAETREEIDGKLIAADWVILAETSENILNDIEGSCILLAPSDKPW